MKAALSAPALLVTGRPVVRRFLMIWLSLVGLLALILWVFYRSQTAAALALNQASQRESLNLSRQVIESQLAFASADLLFLADQARDFQSAARPAVPQTLAQTFLDFVEHKSLYDELRLVNTQGQELIRIERNGGPPLPQVPRILFDPRPWPNAEPFGYMPDRVYVSPFLLEPTSNHGDASPFIRFAAPIFDAAHKQTGTVLLNYRVQWLLERIRAFSSQVGGRLYLVNHQGYWVLGPAPEQEWGWLIPSHATQRFSLSHPQAWSQIRAHGPRQFRTPLGLYTYQQLDPGALVNPGSPVSKPSADEEAWILVAFLPQAQIAKQNAYFLRGLGFIFAGLATLFAAGAWLTAQQQSRRAQAANAVQASETLLRNLLESAPDAIIIVDNAGRIELINAQAERYFGYARAELIGQSVDILVPRRFRDQHADHRALYFSDPRPRSLGVGSAVYGQRKDGSEFPVEISLSPLQTGGAARVISVIRDMTAHRAAETARLAAQQRYRELVNNLPVGVYRKTPGAAGTFLEVNPAMVKMFEASSAEELLSHAVSDIHFDSGSRLALSDKVIREGEVNQEEIQLVTLRGRVFWGAITAAVQKDAEGNIYFDGIIEDISARREVQARIEELNTRLQKRTQALETANAELEAFSYSVSHDLRAPLRALDGFSRLLMEQADSLNEEGQDYLARIRRAAQRMGTLIDDLLNLARVTRSELASEAVDLSEVATTIIEEMRKHEPERQVRFETVGGITAVGDKRLLEILLSNLLGNAWKFTAEKPDAQIRFGWRQEGLRSVYFVSDNGAGFDMAYVDKLFGVFQRLHDAHEFPGTGIGLATVQRIVRKHGGQIWAEGKVGAGATFFFTLKG